MEERLKRGRPGRHRSRIDWMRRGQSDALYLPGTRTWPTGLPQWDCKNYWRTRSSKSYLGLHLLGIRCHRFVMIFVVAFSKFPKVELNEDEKTGDWDTIVHLLKNKTVIVFFFGIFAYVGTEQGVANWISEFLRTSGLRPEVEGAQAVQWYWGLMTIGCILGLGLLKLVDSKLVIRVFILGSMTCLATALFTSDPHISFYAFIAMGFCASVMWSIVFSLGMNSIAEHHGSFSGILCSGIMGGAVTPLIVGSLADHFGLRTGMLFNYVTLSFLLFLSFWAKPLVANQTIFNKVETKPS